MRVTKLWESERNTWKLIRMLKMYELLFLLFLHCTALLILWRATLAIFRIIYSCRTRNRSDQQLDLTDPEREFASDAELFKELLDTEPEFAEAYVSIMPRYCILSNLSFYKRQISGLFFVYRSLLILLFHC